MNILYIRANFPKFSETFIFEEILGLKKRGHNVLVISSFCEIERLHPKVVAEQAFDFVEYRADFLGTPRDYDAFMRSRLRQKGRMGPTTRHYYKNPLRLSIFRLLALLAGSKIFILKPRDTFQNIRQLFRLSCQLDNIWLSLYQCRKKKKFIPDLIHCPFCTIGSLITARRFSEKYGNIPFTVSFRAKDLYAMYNPEPRIRRELVAACSKVMTIAAVNRAEIEHLYPDIGHVPVVHSCIDPDYFFPTRHLKKKKGLIVSVGRLIEKKGFEYLIEACLLLKSEGHVFSCLIIGEGHLESDLRKLVVAKKLENEVTVTGPMLQSEVKNALDCAEMFVLPCITGEDKNRDILPNAVKEAMSMALPVITSNINGITEMIDDHINGILVSPKSSRELAEKIAFLLGNHEKGRELGINARRKILDSFHMDKELAKLENIFHEVCNNSKNRHSRNKQEKNRFVLQKEEV